MPKSKRSRRHYTTEQKAAILKEHLVDKAPVSEVCNKHQLQPSVFYDWLRQVQGNLAGALTNFRKALKLDPDNLVVANNLQILANVTAEARA